MDKKQIHHIRTKIRWIKPWHFLTLAIIFGVISVIALRANNQHMIKLRQAVYVADKQGRDVQKPLRQLQAYVTTHMNTDLSAGKTTVYPPIQLKYTYERLVSANNSQFQTANSQIYNDAQRYCEQQNSADFSGRNRIPCIEQYVQGHTTQKPASVPDALYKFAFVSPRWSPDLAGWSIVIAALSGIGFVTSLIGSRFLKRYFR